MNSKLSLSKTSSALLAMGLRLSAPRLSDEGVVDGKRLKSFKDELVKIR